MRGRLSSDGKVKLLSPVLGWVQRTVKLVFLGDFCEPYSRDICEACRPDLRLERLAFVADAARPCDGGVCATQLQQLAVVGGSD